MNINDLICGIRSSRSLERNSLVLSDAGIHDLLLDFCFGRPVVRLGHKKCWWRAPVEATGRARVRVDTEALSS